MGRDYVLGGQGQEALVLRMGSRLSCFIYFECRFASLVGVRRQSSYEPEGWLTRLN